MPDGSAQQGDAATNNSRSVGSLRRTDLQWLGQLLFGSAAALEHPYRVQPDVQDFLQQAPQGHFAIGFWGHGIQSHAFYVQMVEPWCRVYLRLPYGAYSDQEAQALKLHRVLHWLPSEAGGFDG